MSRIDVWINVLILIIALLLVLVLLLPTVLPMQLLLIVAIIHVCGCVLKILIIICKGIYVFLIVL